MAHSILNAIVDPIVVESKFPEEWDFETLSKNLQKISDKYRGKLQYTTEELNGMTEESFVSQYVMSSMKFMLKKKQKSAANR